MLIFDHYIFLTMVLQPSSQIFGLASIPLDITVAKRDIPTSLLDDES